ncbi:hypothetical protein KFE25_005594 [Diacronema lutheri]|uniref:Protein-serine/threonine kinase n=1 Tax=Diacronema lutheri TaxID=2081491 RepID=A0A8J5XT12_DIALT|nr:hypothetical protein KFE25_005594 [Diacronema lutheri]
MRVSAASLATSRFSAEQAVRFLSAELPVRADRLVRALEPEAPHFAALPSFGALLDSLTRAASACGLRDAAGVAQGARALREGHAALETGVRALVPELRALALEPRGCASAIAAVERVAVGVHRHLIAQRMLVAHLDASCEPSALAEPLCVRACDLGTLCAATADDAVLFCREKHGDAPEVCFAPPAYVHFSLMEVLKNALGAHVRRYGVLGLCDAPPVELALAASAGNAATMRVTDRGGGMDFEARLAAARFFSSTSEERAPSYTYSRAFGSQYDGLGVGLPLAAAHLRFLGGDLAIGTFGDGCTAFLSIDRTGGARTDPADDEEHARCSCG